MCRSPQTNTEVETMKVFINNTCIGDYEFNPMDDRDCYAVKEFAYDYACDQPELETGEVIFESDNGKKNSLGYFFCPISRFNWE